MQRRSSKQSRGPNAAEKAFQGWLKEQPCCCCGNDAPSICHHCVGSSYKHNKVLIGHWFCIPLCDVCHDLRHQHKSGFLHLYGPECDLWNDKAIVYLLTEGDGKLSAEVHNAIMDTNK